jgi:hypothetical protein
MRQWPGARAISAALPGGRRRARRRRLAELRVEVARRRGLASDMIHTSASEFEQDRRMGSILINSEGQVIDSWSGRTSGWPDRPWTSRSMFDELFATPARHDGFRMAGDLDRVEAEAWHWARGEGAHPHPGLD